MKKLQLALAALAAAGTLSLTTIAPASADSAASTRNIILGAAALAGIAIEANVAHKRSQAGTVSGYLPDGSTVYADGRVVARDGDSYYPGNNRQNVQCTDGRCYLSFAADNGGNDYRNHDNGYGNGNEFARDVRPTDRNADAGRGSDQRRGHDGETRTFKDHR